MRDEGQGTSDKGEEKTASVIIIPFMPRPLSLVPFVSKPNFSFTFNCG